MTFGIILEKRLEDPDRLLITKEGTIESLRNERQHNDTIGLNLDRKVWRFAEKESVQLINSITGRTEPGFICEIFKARTEMSLLPEARGRDFHEGQWDRGEVDRAGVDRADLDRGEVDRGEVDRGEVDRGEVDRGEVERGEVERGEGGSA